MDTSNAGKFWVTNLTEKRDSRYSWEVEGTYISMEVLASMV